MSQARAVLFDFGGTLFDYETLAPGEREVLISLARWAGIEADERAHSTDLPSSSEARILRVFAAPVLPAWRPVWRGLALAGERIWCHTER